MFPSMILHQTIKKKYEIFYPFLQFHLAIVAIRSKKTAENINWPG